MEDALSRRIEELALAADPDSAPSRDDAALNGAVNAVRAEVVAVRADLASLRGELGAVRGDLDGLSGRLTGSVAASRTETGSLVRRVAELTTRMEVVGAQVEEVRTAVPGLGRDLREGLDLLPVRTGTALGEASGRITDQLGSRFDAAITDVRRTVGSALDGSARSAAAASAALVDARGALESRLAVLEEAVDSVSERLDSTTRDASVRVVDRVQAVGADLTALGAGLKLAGADQVDRTVERLTTSTGTGLDALSVALHDQVRRSTEELRVELTDGLARQQRESEQTREAVDALAESVRTALAGFAEALGNGLTGLGSSLSGALGESREQHRTEIVGLSGRLLASVGDLELGLGRQQVETAARLDALQAALEARSESVRSGVASALEQVRSDLGSEVGVLRPLVEGVAGDVAGQSAAASLLRTDVLDALESVRERVTTSTTAAVHGVRTTLDTTRSELGEAQRQLRQAVLDRLEEQHTVTVTRLEEARAARDAAAAADQGRADALVSALGQSTEGVRGLVTTEADRVLTGQQERAGAVTAKVDEAVGALLATLSSQAGADQTRSEERGTALARATESAVRDQQERAAVLLARVDDSGAASARP